MSRRPLAACRTCLRMNQTCIGIFEHYERNKSLSEMLRECTGVKVEQRDGLPIYMCNACLEKLISAWNFRAMAVHSDQKFRNNKDTSAPLLLESNECTEDIIHEDMNVKQEEIMIKLEESDLTLVNKEVCDNKLDGHLEKSNLLIVEYTDCTSVMLEQDKRSSPDSSEELSVEVCNTDDSGSKSEDVHKEDENPRGQANNVLRGEVETVDVGKVNELMNIADNGIGFDENGVPVTRNGCKLTWQERQKVPVFCKPCNRSFPWKYYLVHRRKHVGDLRYKCDTCNKVFPAMYQLTAHKQIHMDDRLHTCDVCNKSFKRKSNLRMHKQIHNEERPHKCNICDLSFKQLQGLKLHMQRHSKEKQYVCEICGKSFNDAGSFSSHKTMHIEDKKHACSICGKRFHAPSRLKEHENRIHFNYRPYVCSHCGKGFKMGCSLKKHILIHTGEKPYSCNICGKRFRHRECLPGHIRTHTGETPFHCEKCPATFKHLHLLKKHIK
ncbi:zinc-finger associated domain containing protein, partial [Oryctes borbonicus]